MFHQPQNTFGCKIYNSMQYDDLTYRPHFHKSFELWYCAEGSVSVGADGKDTVLACGDYMLIFPYTVHAFSVRPPSRLWVAVFSGDYVPELEQLSKTVRPAIKAFHVDEATQKFLDRTLMERRYLPDDLRTRPDSPAGHEVCAIKSGLYALAGAFMKDADLLPISRPNSLVMEIIRYIEDNFTADITLRSAADALGYNGQYLSRIFRNTLNIPFRSLINQYRFDYACKLLEQEGVSVTQAALDAGFQSVRNFNRIYREKTGSSPKRP